MVTDEFEDQIGKRIYQWMWLPRILTREKFGIALCNKSGVHWLWLQSTSCEYSGSISSRNYLLKFITGRRCRY